jgi:hypothetical protein
MYGGLMTQEQKEFAAGVSGFGLQVRDPRYRGRSPEYYRGWTWGWGRSDALRGEICAFPDDPDYSAGYLDLPTELHITSHELSLTA